MYSNSPEHLDMCKHLLADPSQKSGGPPLRWTPTLALVTHGEKNVDGWDIQWAIN